MHDPLLHHGDVELGDGLLDLAVNVYVGARPIWLDAALHGAIDQAASYPNSQAATVAVAEHHRRSATDVLLTAGAAEAFSLIARLRPWRRPVVIHPQFTEPHAALLQAGRDVTSVLLPRPFMLEAELVPEDADLVMIGNPTNPTGVLHRASLLRSLTRPGRVVVVDEAFMDTIPGQGESLAEAAAPGLIVIRSLTKHWSIPGIRAGYLLGDAEIVAALSAGQVPWSLSSPALAAALACTTQAARIESERRAQTIAGWRNHLEEGLADLGVDHLRSSTSFVLACAGDRLHCRLRKAGVAVRRADTFPGLGPSWIRIAVRPPQITTRFLTTLEKLL